MIVRINGRLGEMDEGRVVIERDGLAYEVLVPSCAVTELSAYHGEAVTLHTLEYFEGSAAGGNLIPRLIGFLHPEDRAFFQQFVTVKGIGVRKGLRALAEPIARIAAYIEAGDAAALARLPGIGRRMSAQIIAELKGKVTPYAYTATDVPAAAKRDLSDDQRDAIEILVAWGDARTDAERWIARAAQLHDDIKSPEDWVRAAYRIKSGAER
jgi:Holliday junction DNA helicase RuvA